MTTPKDGTTKKRKGVKARRMYASPYDMAGNFLVFHPSTKWGKIIPVAVLNVSDEAALIEQAALALCPYALSDIDPSLLQIYKRAAFNVLESLGIIKKARK